MLKTDLIRDTNLQVELFEWSKKTSILCAKSATCSPQLPEYLTVRNSQKQTQRIAKTAGLCIPVKICCKTKF